MAPQVTGEHQQQTNMATETTVKVQNDTKQVKSKGCCRTFTNKINKALEGCFAKLGFTVATHPWKTIFIALLLSLACVIGIIEKKDENRGEKNWVSQTSDPVKHKDWIDGVFPIAFRTANILLERSNSKNMLTPSGLKKLYDLDMLTRAIYNETARRQWHDMCFSPTGKSSGCTPTSILELWSYDINKISNLTKDDIKIKINEPKLRSPMTGRLVNMNLIIGGTIIRDINGTIMTATVLKMDYKIKKRAVFDKGEGKEIDVDADAWEEEFDNVFKVDFPGFNLYSFSRWAQQKTSGDATSGDLKFFVIGYILVIVYLSIMLGSFSRINHKIYLAISGILVIGISIGVAFGLGSAFQFKYTTVHNVLPFLLLGIGVDDVFVIVQSWENIGGTKKDHRSIPEKMSLTLRHAGVSVLVTSVTDICAFAIGAATILPALRSFSIWSAIGILSVFLLTITLFVALLTLDAKRQENHSDACLCCLKLSDTYEPMKCSEKKLLKGFLKNQYAPVLLSTPGKIISLLIVAGILAGGAYGLSELEQDFDFNWFLPLSSRPRMYTDKDREAFPGNGFAGNVYIGQIDYYNGWEKLNVIKDTLDNNQYIAKGSINSWFHHYHTWLYNNYNDTLIPKGCIETTCRAKNDTEFIRLLKEFLQTADGENYRSRVLFNGDTIKATKIGYRHIKLSGSSEEIKAMDSIQEEIKPGLIADEADPLLPFAFARLYINWETNKVISKELIRNLALAGMCVFIVTLFLISNITTSLMVVACVAFSLIDIAGFMGFWGLTIDTVTTIILVIAIGLTVDYSVHIGHGFMASKAGNKNDRVIAALADVGPAVIHGGMSTFLAFALLASSESYVFKTFFKVFFLVVVFGIFHGMVFLPVVLSLIGPAPYADHLGVEERKRTNVVDSVGRNEPVRLEKVTKTNEDTFIVVVGDKGQQNIAYVSKE